MLSYRTVRNFGLGTLLIAILSVNAFYFFLQKRIIKSFEYVVKVEEEKLTNWINISELASEAKGSFYKNVINESYFVAPVIFLVAELNNEVEKLEGLDKDADEQAILTHIKDAQRKFQSAVFAYGREVSGGYYGASAKEMRQLALAAADEIADISRMAAAEINNSIAENNKNILERIQQLNQTLIPILIAGILLVFFVALGMTLAISKPTKMLSEAMYKAAGGDLSYRLKAVSKDEIGRLAGAFNKMMDELQDAKNKLIETNMLVNKITDGIDEGIMLIDNNFKILWANKKIMESMESKEIINNYCYKVTHKIEKPCSAEGHFCPLDETVRTGKPSTVLHTHSTDGNKIFVEVSTYPFYDEKGKEESFIHVSRDITKKMRLEEELKKSLALVEKAKADMQVKMEELARFNKLAVDREIKMVELKEKLKSLEERLDNKA